MISNRIVQSAIMGLSHCLMAVTLYSGSYSLLGQGTAPGGHLAEEGFSGGAIHRQVCFVTADCGNPTEPVSWHRAHRHRRLHAEPAECSNAGPG